MSSVENFNKTLEQLLTTVLENYPEQNNSIRKHYNLPIDLTNDTYIRNFIQNCSGKGQDISTKNEIIFSKDIVLVTGVNFYDIWNDSSLSDQHRENIWKYLHTLYIYSFEHQNKKNTKELLKELKNINSDQEFLDETTQTFLNIIDSLTQKFPESLDGVDIDEEEDDSGPSIPGFKMPDILGGSIGDLAKEIADEIDTDKLNLEDPGKLLKGLLSGNLENDDSGLMGLVENITGKIHEKVNSGELDQDKLFSEAQGVMSSFNKMGGGGNSNLFANLFSQMSQGNGDGNINLDLNSLQESSNVKLDKAKMENKINLQNKPKRPTHLLT